MMTPERQAIFTPSGYYGAQEDIYAESQRASRTSVVSATVAAAGLVCLGMLAVTSMPRAGLQSATELSLPTAVAQTRNAVVGAAVAGAAVAGTAMPAYAQEMPTFAPQPEQRFVMPERAPLYTIAEAPAIEEDLTAEYIKTAIGALFIPIIGYGSWRFGSYKAQQDAAEGVKAYEKSVEEGTVMKISPSGIPSIKGFAMASDAGWALQSEELRSWGINGISGEEIIEMSKAGNVTIIDVRPAYKYKDGAIPGSINVPLFQPITGFSPFKLLRRFQFALFGVEGTEYNPEFQAMIKETLSKVGDNKVVFLDDSVRGTLSPTDAFPEGKAGHALMSIYLARKEGYEPMMQYLEGGLTEFVKADGELTTA